MFQINSNFNLRDKNMFKGLETSTERIYKETVKAPWTSEIKLVLSFYLNLFYKFQLESTFKNDKKILQGIIDKILEYKVKIEESKKWSKLFQKINLIIFFS